MRAMRSKVRKSSPSLLTGLPLLAAVVAGGAAVVLAAALATIAGAPLEASGPDDEYPHGDFEGDCATCHRVEEWGAVKPGPDFDHGKFGFPLKGAHEGVYCRVCHKNLDFTKADPTCVGCHTDVHRGEFGTDCARCHTTRNFIERAGDVRSHRLTRFPLQGAHAVVDCSACHKPASSGHATYVNTPTECERCHLDAYRAASNPDHVASGFPTDCSRCHTPAGWQAARIDHAAFGFPLTGAHLGLPCDVCHPGGRFKGTPPDCYACHQADYVATANPPHAAAGFSTDCRTCHTPKAWRPSSFNHGTTAFPLTGAHKALECNACHGDGVYAGKPSDCVACHQSDYDATTNPNHTAAGFPTDCAACHSTAAWQGARFAHDQRYFPIYSGKHAGRWSTCSTCHTNSSNYSDFTCFNCHRHADKVKTDADHSRVSGYSYDSQACYGCHPTGRAED